MSSHMTPSTQAPAASMYAGMSQAALLQECDRLQMLTHSQAHCIKDIHQSTSKVIEGLLQECERLELLTSRQAQCNKDLHQSVLKMIRAWASVIQAHSDQDDAAVHKALTVAIAKLKEPVEVFH